MSDNQRDSDIRNVIGTFAAEGIDLKEDTIRRLEKIYSGELTYKEAIKLLKEKYNKGDTK